MRLLFYQSCRVIKRYFDPDMKDSMIQSIDAYLLNFQFQPFQKYLIENEPPQSAAPISDQPIWLEPTLEALTKTFPINKLSLSALNDIYRTIDCPISPINQGIDYNWVVDGILKNSTPYATSNNGSVVQSHKNFSISTTELL